MHSETDGNVRCVFNGRTKDAKEFAYNEKHLKKGVVCFCYLESNHFVEPGGRRQRNESVEGRAFSVLHTLSTSGDNACALGEIEHLYKGKGKGEKRGVSNQSKDLSFIFFRMKKRLSSTSFYHLPRWTLPSKAGIVYPPFCYREPIGILSSIDP